ncbi:MAG: hypothetical protein K6G06_02765 [Butyrivibrio sp.]|nr:hypothetical protein [Butyrivibrio sp.]
MLFQFSMICFFTVSLILFHLLPVKIRKWSLLLFSTLFVYWQGKNFGLVVLLLISLLSYGAGLIIEALKKSDSATLVKSVAVFNIAFFAVVLFGWKYMELAASLLSVHIPDRITNAGIPVGLSFYTFQAISYVADVWMGKTEAEKNPFKYAIYMMWFPKWMSGPIERAGDFIEKLDSCGNTRLLDEKRYERGVTYIVWGLFMKLMIADRLGVVVDKVYEDPSVYGFGVLILTALLYSIQIYCDFAGYTNTMIGVSSFYGIELTQNFRVPYMAENIVDFWRCWHISLSNFLKDYVYIPLGGNRKGSFKKAINTLVVFIICGIWHGVGLSFIVWGLWHGIFNVIASFLRKTKAEFLIKGAIGRFISFCLVSFAWIFFRASSIGQALVFIKGMLPFGAELAAFTGFAVEEKALLGISVMEWWIAAIAVLLLVVMDVAAWKKKLIPPELISGKWGVAGRTVLLTLAMIAVIIFGRYGSGDEIRSFVYMQF